MLRGELALMRSGLRERTTGLALGQQFRRNSTKITSRIPPSVTSSRICAKDSGTPTAEESLAFGPNRRGREAGTTAGREFAPQLSLQLRR